jgi:hypothetical protein
VKYTRDTIPAMPELPLKLDKDGNPELLEWPDYAHRAWVAWWMDPASQMWDESDVMLLEHALELRVAGRHTITAAAEMRQILDRLGLTQKGKRDLRWKVNRNLDPAERPLPGQRAAAQTAPRATKAGAEPEDPAAAVAQIDDYRKQMGVD